MASQDYLTKNKLLTSAQDLASQTTIDFDLNGTAFRVLLHKNNLPKLAETFATDIVINDPAGALEAVRAGLGLGFCPLDAMDPSLVPCTWPPENHVTAGIECVSRIRRYPDVRIQTCLNFFKTNAEETTANPELA